MDEIKEATFLIWDDKAPGSDGYNSVFFKRTWCIIGGNTVEVIQSFLLSGRLLREVDCTAVSLIPKMSNASFFTDFHPISCCNTIYKCINKILVRLMMEKIQELVGVNETTFIPGQRMEDNIHLAQEVFQNYRCSFGTPRCGLKVYIKKAYDHVR